MCARVAQLTSWALARAEAIMAAAGDLKARLKALKALPTCKRVLCSTCHPALKGHGPGVFCNLQIPAAFVWVGVRATLVPGRQRSMP